MCGFGHRTPFLQHLYLLFKLTFRPLQWQPCPAARKTLTASLLSMSALPSSSIRTTSLRFLAAARWRGVRPLCAGAESANRKNVRKICDQRSLQRFRTCQRLVSARRLSGTTCLQGIARGARVTWVDMLTSALLSRSRRAMSAATASWGHLSTAAASGIHWSCRPQLSRQHQFL